jgi:hypothetical protein
MVENQDRNVGRVLATLEELDLADGTIVIYFSDNGPNTMRWNGGMKGRKGTTDEGGIRSPGFIRWPEKIAAGTTVTPITAAIDLLPTLVSMAGIVRVGDQPLDGRDLTPLLLTTDRDPATAAANWPERMLFSTWAGKTSVRTQRHRLDDQGRLYDMLDDPAQQRDRSDSEPQTAARLREAVQAWVAEMRREAERQPRPAFVAGKVRQVVDPRPIHVGYPQFPITILPARDASPIGEVTRSSSAPNSSYFVNWTSTADRIVWNVEVQTAGRYQVTIDYTCPLADAGSLIELSLGEASLRGAVRPGWDPPLYDNQDTLPRPLAESKMKPFKSLDLGQIDLPAAAGELTLRAIQIPGDQVMDVRRITLTLLQP